MRPLLLTVAALALVFAVSDQPSLAQGSPSTEIAPQGKLRVAMIGANPVLVTRKADGSVGGTSVDIATYIARSLGVPLVPVVYADPAEYTKSFGAGAWDIAIGPRESATAAGLSVSPDIMWVENLFVVAPGRAISSAGDVDRPGVRLVVAKDGAPDRFLTPRLKSVEFVRTSATTESVTTLFRGNLADVYASNAQAVHAVADAMPGAKVLSEAFTAVPMAVALDRGHSQAAAIAVSAIVVEARRTGIVQKAIDAAGLRGVKAARD